MAANQINVGINVSSNGTTDKETKKAKGLKDMLDQAAVSAQRAGRAMAASRSGVGGGGTTGPVTSQEVMEYGRSRAVGVGTGASARDFANQAQGLGGLVRLYATYAANVFAVGAAFRALSDAMNTANMVRGLDQLGAASGTALGTLAKRFEEASGGAISLRESMEATTKAVSSGLSAKQFLQLGDVAKKASQALGLNMSDAVSRLTRGITKLEPELLDELGLFTKIGPATEEYAKRVGKTVSSLTDFERRQAFANAVLEEGISKFGQIDLPTNPYDKLAASLRNLTQQILEVVNVGLGPLINILSTSPTALGAGIAALGVTLLKQALPALGEYRRELQQSAAIATQRAQVKAQEANEARLQAFGAAIKKADQEAQDAADRADANLTKVEKLIKASRSRVAESVKPILAKQNILEITPQELKVLDDLGAKNTKLGATYRQLATDIRAAIAENDKYNLAVQAQASARAQQPGRFTAAGRAQAIAKRAEDIATQQTIISQAGYAGSVMSLRQGFSEMFKSIGESQMGPIRKGFTAVAGSVSLVTTALTSAISAVQGWIFIAGALVAGFKVLDSWLSNNKEQLQKFNSAIDDSQVAVKTYGDTLDYLSKNIGKTFTTAGLTAYANAVTGLSDSIKRLGEDFIELEKKTKGWDRFTDSVLNFFGGGQAKEFAEGMSKLLIATAASIDDAAQRLDFESKISKALGVGTGGPAAWQDAIVKGGIKSASALKDLQPEIDKITLALNNSSSRATEFDGSLKEVSDSYKKFTTDVKDKDPYTQLGNNLLTFSTKLSGVMTDPNIGLNKFLDLLKESSTLQLVSPDQLNSLTNLRARMGSLADVSSKTADELRSARLREAQLRNDIEQRVSQYTDPKLRDVNRTALLLESETGRELQNVQRNIDGLTARQERVTAEIKELMKDPTFGRIIRDSFEKGAKIAGREIELATKKSNIEFSQGVLGLISDDVLGKASIETKLKLDELDLRKTAIKLQQDQIQAQNAGTLALMANTNVLERQKLEPIVGPLGSGLEPGRVRTAEETAAVERMNQLTAFTNFIKDVTAFSAGKGGDAQALLSRGVKLQQTLAPEDVQGYTQIAGLINIISNRSKNLAELQSISAAQRLESLRGEKKETEEKLKLESNITDYVERSIRSQIEGINLANSLLDVADENLLNKKHSLELQLAEFKASKAIQANDARLQDNLKFINELKASGALKSEQDAENLRKMVTQSNELLNTGVTLNLEEDRRSIIKDRIKNTESKITKEMEKQRQEVENKLALDKLAQEKAEAIANKEKARLDILKSIDSLSKQDLQRRQNASDFIDLEVSQQEKLKAFEEDRRKALDPLMEQRKKAVATVGTISLVGEQDAALLNAAMAELERIDKLVKNTNVEYDKRLKLLKEALGVDKETLAIKQRDALLVAKFEDTEKKRTQEKELTDIVLQGQEQLLELSRQRLEIDRENGIISEDSYNQSIRGLEIERRERDLNNKQLEITTKYQALRNKLELDFQRALNASGGVLDDYTANLFQEERERLSRNLNLELGNLKDLRDGYAATDAARRDLSTRQKGYNDLLENSFYKVSDSISDWLASGETSFKSFKKVIKDSVTSILAEILKLELRLQAQDMWLAFRKNMLGATGGGGNIGQTFLGTIIQGITGGTAGDLGVGSGSLDLLSAPAPVVTAVPRVISVDQMIDRWNLKAKGAAYIGGMEHFAKGGAFTNSIIDNPTIFKFAKGVGMMGEAGPEAIMPLKRDGQGNLGVRAQGGKTEVVVNNYSGEQASAREVTDSRGNRRIEVTVGDMVAGEMARSGSATQKSVRGTFGLQPQLIRR